MKLYRCVLCNTPFDKKDGNCPLCGQKVKLIYFAHSRQIYGTKVEKQILLYLSKKFGRINVCCPNNDMGELGSIEPYLEKVANSSMVIVHQFKNHVGKGAYQEVKEALAKNILVKVIICGKGRMRSGPPRYDLKEVKAIKIVDNTDWKVRYGQVITGKL